MRTQRTKDTLKSYYLSKWICEVHGRFIARTEKPVNPDFPIHCPDCNAKFVDQIEGKTVLPVPFVSKPAWPKVADKQFTGDKAPLRKRKAIW